MPETAMKRIFLLPLLAVVPFICAEVAHVSQGTSYSNLGVQAYAQSKHGIDGGLFLDPYFLPFITAVKNLKLLDAGCGAGPWSIVAAKNGAQVYGLDIQEGMIAHAKKSALEQGIAGATDFTVGSVSQLPHANNFFDKAISINVGCNLPTEVFNAHFTELFRVLKPEGRVLITAPATFETVFTTDFNNASAIKEINQLLAALKTTEPDQIRKSFSGLQKVLRATFVVRDGKLILVTKETKLVEGEPIWRKIPGLVVPNYYHSEEAYLTQLQAAGFTIDHIDRPHFDSVDAWRNSSVLVGIEYCYFNPFVIIQASKKSN